MVWKDGVFVGRFKDSATHGQPMTFFFFSPYARNDSFPHAVLQGAFICVSTFFLSQ